MPITSILAAILLIAPVGIEMSAYGRLLFVSYEAFNRTSRN